MSGGTGMPESQLFLVSANKSQPSGQWSSDDYDVWRKTNFPVSTVGRGHFTKLQQICRAKTA
jgi:hypothetical protein